MGHFCRQHLGCLIIGVVFGLSERFQWLPEWRVFLAAGFCAVLLLSHLSPSKIYCYYRTKITSPFLLTAGHVRDVDYVKLTELVDKVEAADAYTDEMGVQLGIVKTPGEPVSPGSVKPVIEAASPAATGYSFTIVISGREDSTSADALIRRSGSETLKKEETFTGKSCDVTLTPTTPGVPEKVQVVIQLKRKNENYGQPSDAVSVTLNP